MTAHTSVENFDVAIFGGGIAGIAVAERLAREAARQQRNIRIILVERNEQLGSETSSQLEGWFHSGALYAKPGFESQFRTCVQSLEDLYNWYRLDRSFSFWKHCNLMDIEATRCPQHDFSQASSRSWFLDSLQYVLPVAPHRQGGNLTETAHDWARIASRVKALVSQTFYEREWFNGGETCCRAPKVDFSAALLNSDGPERTNDFDAAERCDDRFHALADIRDSLAKAEGIAFETMFSLDAALNPWLVLRDLAEAASNYGVEILTGYEVVSESLSMSGRGGEPRVWNALIRRTESASRRDDSRSRPDRVQIVAREYVFALGKGFVGNDFIGEAIGGGFRVHNEVRVMTVAVPAFSERSFARMDSNHADDFNHIHRRSTDGTLVYSIIADSNGLSVDSTLEQRVAAASHLARKATRYFGDTVNRSLLWWYDCQRTAISSDEGREYTYYVGPRRRFESETWREAFGDEHDVTADAIRNAVFDRSGDQITLAGGRTAPLKDSAWATRRALHFAMQRIVSTSRDGSAERSLDAHHDFVTLRDRAVPRADEGASHDSNVLCVAPGKFSFFPSLAHQAYLELEIRGLFRDLPRASDKPVSFSRGSVDDLIAPPRAEAQGLERVPKLSASSSGGKR